MNDLRRPEAWPWGPDRKGVPEWRNGIADPEKEEREFRDLFARSMRAGENESRNGVTVDEVYLHGSFPLTELATILRLEREAPGCRFGYTGWIWEDPDMVQLYDVYFDEMINDYRRPLARDAKERGCDPKTVTWVERAPGEPGRPIGDGAVVFKAPR
jgi:hypothetical protein